MQSSSSKDLSRRDLLKSAAVAGAGLTVGRSVAWADDASKGGGWKVLFDGKKLDAWDYEPTGWQVQEDGSLYTPGKGRDIFSKEKFQDFTLLLEFKVSKGCNSGVFVRMADRKDWLHSSIEFQVLDSFGKATVGKHDCAAMYDAKAPDHNAVKKAGEWNKLHITCFKNQIFVALNSIQVHKIDLNQWDTAHKNPDGSKNKFRDPLKKIQHAGYLALQTHGKPCWYRKIKVRPLTKLAKCPVCGAEGPEGWYCAKCNAVCTSVGKFKCKKNASKMMTAGTYCPKANRFRFPAGSPKCPGCGNEKGMWCEKGCDAYTMTFGVAYCDKCKKPYAKTPAGCPRCGKKKG